MGDTSIAEHRTCAACGTAIGLFPFSMAFQPIVDLERCEIHAHEALVRGPTGSPARTVLDQVTNENRYAFDQACRVKAIELAARLGMQTRLSINFLPNAVYDPRACIRQTLDAAQRTGFPSNRIIFEIVEGEQIADDAHLLGIIREYRRQGFAVALDDFGTGYSGLARLARLQPDIIKLDRVLVAGCDKSPVQRSIIGATALLCRDMGVKLVVEGVETAAELDVVRAAHIRFVQGFYFAQPAFEYVTQAHDIKALCGPALSTAG
jgi:EAL domain-containing protein (putative c-di-GMP-specific phosphodiesterase class I)